MRHSIFNFFVDRGGEEYLIDEISAYCDMEIAGFFSYVAIEDIKIEKIDKKYVDIVGDLTLNEVSQLKSIFEREIKK